MSPIKSSSYLFGKYRNLYTMKDTVKETIKEDAQIPFLLFHSIIYVPLQSFIIYDNSSWYKLVLFSIVWLESKERNHLSQSLHMINVCDIMNNIYFIKIEIPRIEDYQTLYIMYFISSI